MVSPISILGTLSLLGGSLGYFTFPATLSYGVRMMVNLDENGMVYPLYMNPPFATQSKFYLFAITNPRESLRGEKMKFEMKGPYYYKTYLVRDNIVFKQSNQRVKYDSMRKLYAQEDISADFDEKMWLVNPILPTVLKIVKSLILDRIPFQRLSEPIVMNTVNVLLDSFKERLIVRSTPRVFLNGRKVELLQSLSDLAGRFGLSSIVPPGPPKNIFGLASVQNETIDNLEIFTGIGDSKNKFGEVALFNDKPRLEVWKGSCSRITGTNGELYKPNVNVGKHLNVFFTPLCRSFTLLPIRNEPVTSDSGMTIWEFQFNPSMFSGSRSNPQNECFCEDKRTYDCQYDGLIAMGPCFFNSPLYFTRGNFKGVDKRITDTTKFFETINQTMPDEQIIGLDRITGTILRINVTLMAAYKIVRQPIMRDLSRLPNLTYAPAFLATESVELPFKYAWQIYLLQQIDHYHKPAMIGTALMGGGTLLWKFIFGGH